MSLRSRTDRSRPFKALSQNTPDMKDEVAVRGVYSHDIVLHKPGNMTKQPLVNIAMNRVRVIRGFGANKFRHAVIRTQGLISHAVQGGYSISESCLSDGNF
jgi:hypothetical protein